MPQIQTGVIVSVRNNGGTYDTYDHAAEKLKLKHWARGELPIEGGLYKVIGTMTHEHNDDGIVLGIESIHNKEKQFLISKNYVDYVREGDKQFVFNF